MNRQFIGGVRAVREPPLRIKLHPLIQQRQHQKQRTLSSTETVRPAIANNII